MAKPRSTYISDCADLSGMEATWVKRRRKLSFSGWYDSFVGIGGREMSLREFFDELGITEADCRAAFAEEKPDADEARALPD